MRLLYPILILDSGVTTVGIHALTHRDTSTLFATPQDNLTWTDPLQPVRAWQSNYLCCFSTYLASRTPVAFLHQEPRSCRSP